jgi:hypothetical protein
MATGTVFHLPDLSQKIPRERVFFSLIDAQTGAKAAFAL